MQAKGFKKIITPIFVILFMAIGKVIAQKPIEFNAGQSQFTIPKFTEGTVEGFDNDFVKRGIIPSIKQVAAPVEIRVYRWTQGRTQSLIFGRVYVIQCDSGIVKCITYAGRGEIAIDIIDEKEANHPQPALGNIVDSIQYYKWATYAQPPMPADTILNTLIADKLFCLQDEPSHIRGLQLSQLKSVRTADSAIYKCANCYAGETMLLEVKIGYNIRNFRIMAREYGEPASLRVQLSQYARLREFLYVLMYGNTQN